MKPKIKFSHIYPKMPHDIKDTRLKHKIVSIIEVDLKDLPDEFKEYDTRFFNLETGKWEHYIFPFEGKCIVILIISSRVFEIYTERILWTTIRRWTPEKAEYYTGLTGKEVEIVIE